MHLPQLNAYGAYALAAGAARRDKAKSAEAEAFVIESALEKRDDGGNFAEAQRDRDGPPEEQLSPFEEIYAVAFSPLDQALESDAPMPEDALDAHGLCAMLGAAPVR